MPARAKILKLVPVRAPAPNKSAVRVLREALRLALDGELQSVGICGVLANKEAYTAASEGDHLPLIGALHVLDKRLG